MNGNAILVLFEYLILKQKDQHLQDIYVQDYGMARNIIYKLIAIQHLLKIGMKK